MRFQRTRRIGTGLSRRPRAIHAIGAALSVAALAAIAVAPSASAQAPPLQSEIELLAAQGTIAAVELGVVIIDADTGEVLGSINERQPLIPASNMKLLSSGAALTVLGSDFEFVTELIYAPQGASGTDDADETDEVLGGALEGDQPESSGQLIVLGSGDPAFGDPRLLDIAALSPEAFVDRWATAAAKRQIASVAEIVVDDRVFDRRPVHPTWPIEQLNRWYCAEVAGLNFHTNVLTIYTSPTRAGEPADLHEEPVSPWIELKNKSRTVTRSSHSAWASRRFMTNDITVHGDVRFSSSPIDVTLHDVPTYFGELLRSRLAQQGIDVPTVRLAQTDEELTEGETIALVRTPMAVVMERINRDSQNMYAEALLKRAGHRVSGEPGSWTNGAAMVRMVLSERLGPSAAELVAIADGSGMSRENRVAPLELARWLRSFHDDEQFGASFRDSLATPGEGTLRRRFRGKTLHADVAAKSGLLSGVSALSGYVTEPESGKTLIFSVISNERPTNVPLATVRTFEESIVKLCDDYVKRFKPRDETEPGKKDTTTNPWGG